MNLLPDFFRGSTAFAIFVLTSLPAFAAGTTYPLAGTQQDRCFDDKGAIRGYDACPTPGKPFYGQDTNRPGPKAAYRDDNDGTITDLVTGLTWTKEIGPKVTLAEAQAKAETMVIGGYDNWRLPTIKELYSLVDFRGTSSTDPQLVRPYIDSSVFDFKYGDVSRGDQPTDVQTWSSTEYTGALKEHKRAVFAVNFADGTIKAYPLQDTRGKPMKMYVRFVHGQGTYGKNKFEEILGGLVEDKATGLLWQRYDDGKKRTWQEALSYCEGLYLAGHAEWHLPNAKELQSIVDYSRSPKATGTSALSLVFGITDPKAYFWTSTTHLEGDGTRPPVGSMALYVAFGEARSWALSPDGKKSILVDTHGAGAVLSEPKAGDPDDFPKGLPPDDDDVHIKNYVRCVIKQ
jgi:hypothetical protein